MWKIFGDILGRINKGAQTFLQSPVMRGGAKQENGSRVGRTTEYIKCYKIYIFIHIFRIGIFASTFAIVFLDKLGRVCAGANTF